MTRISAGAFSLAVAAAAASAAIGSAKTVSLGFVPGAASGTPDPLFQALIVDGMLTTVPSAPRTGRSDGPSALARVLSAWLRVFPAPLVADRSSLSASLLSPLAPVASAPPEADSGDALVIEHQRVGCVVAERYPRFEACLQPRDKVGRAQVFFRSKGTEAWYAVDMEPEGSCYSALLPKPKVSLQEFQYYIGAVDLDFESRQRPERAPEDAFSARVVRAEGDCEKDARLAASVLKSSSAVAVEALAGGRVPEGFSDEGVSSSAAGLTASLVATGASSGEVLQLQAVNASGSPARVVVPPGLVLVPVGHAAGSPVAARVKGGVHTASITGFCLDFAKPPPVPGTLYRVADPAGQEGFRSTRRLIDAGKRLSRQGRFHPDSDPAAYGDSIRQWALWTRLSGWTAAQFADAFVSRTRKNVEQMKKAWTPQMESAIRAAAPARWKDISQVLDEAEKPAP